MLAGVVDGTSEPLVVLPVECLPGVEKLWHKNHRNDLRLIGSTNPGRPTVGCQSDMMGMHFKQAALLTGEVVILSEVEVGPFIHAGENKKFWLLMSPRVQIVCIFVSPPSRTHQLLRARRAITATLYLP